MDDTLGACRAIWRDAPATFEGDTVSFQALHCEPRPIQAGGPPIWFGVGMGPKNAARVARFGCGWMPIRPEPEALERGADLLREAFVAAGRDPGEVGVRGAPAPVRGKSGRPDLGATLDAVPALLAAGATMISLPVAAFVGKRSAVPAFLEAFAERAAG
jgi:hypothetical protein